MADVQLIIAEIRRARPLTMGAGVFLIAVGIAGSFIPVEAGAAAWVPYAKWAMLAALAGVGILTFVTALKPPEQHASVLLLTRAPESIVWAHVLVQRTNGQHTGTTLVLCTDQGKKVEAPLPRSEEGERRGMALVRELAPRATLGFRPEYESRFAKDPASLRQA